IPVDGVPLAAAPGGGTLGDVLTARRLPLPWVADPQPIADSGFVDLWPDQPPFSVVQQQTDPRWNDRTRYLLDPGSDPIDTPGWKYADATSYRTNSYPRTAAVLRSLQALIGWEAFARGMRRYSETWRYAHPTPDDFFHTFQEGAGTDVSWYFRELFRTT